MRAESLYVKFDPLVGNANMLPQGPPQVVDGEENTKASIPQPTLDTPKRNPAVAAIDRLLIYSPAAGTPHKVKEPPKIEEVILSFQINRLYFFMYSLFCNFQQKIMFDLFKFRIHDN